MEVIIHTGLQRTGTTFLQDEIFKRLDGDRIVFWRFRDPEVHRKLINIDRIDLDEARKWYEERLSRHKVNLISEENINCRPNKPEDRRSMRLRRLHKLFPEARIIFGTREKESLKVSWYNKHIVRGGVCSYRQYLRDFNVERKLDFEPYTRELLGVYGERNVLIYRFEDMRADLDGHVRRICDFIGVEPPGYKNVRPNRSYSLWQLKTALLINNLFRTKANPGGLLPLEYHYHPHRRLFQSNRFPESLRGRKITEQELLRIEVR